MNVYYLDADFMLHVENDGTMTEWADEMGFFDGKGQSFIEGYRVVPDGMTWKRSDGKMFKGLMIAPAKDVAVLTMAQLQEEMDDMREALELLGVKANG